MYFRFPTGLLGRSQSAQCRINTLNHSRYLLATDGILPDVRDDNIDSSLKHFVLLLALCNRKLFRVLGFGDLPSLLLAFDTFTFTFGGRPSLPRFFLQRAGTLIMLPNGICYDVG